MTSIVSPTASSVHHPGLSVPVGGLVRSVFSSWNSEARYPAIDESPPMSAEELARALELVRRFAVEVERILAGAP